LETKKQPRWQVEKTKSQSHFEIGGVALVGGQALLEFTDLQELEFSDQATQLSYEGDVFRYVSAQLAVFRVLLEELFHILYGVNLPSDQFRGHRLRLKLRDIRLHRRAQVPKVSIQVLREEPVLLRAQYHLLKLWSDLWRTG
jgi:hypothetical protein